MNGDFYKQLIEESPTGYAYHRIICDKHGIPCDYEFIDVNAAYEALTGLKSCNIVGKKITEVFPNISKDEFDWIHFYGDIAINGGKKEFEKYDELLNKLYRISVYSPEINYFITTFIDISKESEQLSEMKNCKLTSWEAERKSLLLRVTNSDIKEDKLTEELMIRKKIFQKLISDISFDFINATVGNIDDKIKNMLKISGEFFKVDSSCIFEVSTDGKNVENIHEWCAEGLDPLTNCTNGFSVDILPWWAEKIRSCELVYIPDMDKLPKEAVLEKEAFKILHIQSILNIQMISNNRLIGSMSYSSIRVKKVWGEDEIAFLKILANTVSNTISKNKIEKEIVTSKEKAEKENSLKTEFFANISHEFRTPLNVMLSTIQLFELYERNKKNLTREKTTRHLKSMKQNSLRLLRLVNNLIDVSKIDSGFYEPTFNNYDIVNIIKKILFSIKDYTKQKNIKIKFRSDLKEKIVKCDVDMIERIMFNLISNAIKFTEENCIIQISITNKVDTVVITVKDNGIGIEKNNLEIIFEKYMQASRTLSRMREGSGIGLSLTKSLVEMHGGTINVKSNYGKGSEFIIQIPNVQCIIEEVVSNRFDDTQDNLRVISKMNVEFSDIYS